jgi:hypothetical protein
MLEGTDSVSQNVAGSVRGWTDRQGTFKEIFARVQIKHLRQRHISVRAKHLLRPISALGNIRRRHISVTENTCRGDISVREKPTVEIFPSEAEQIFPSLEYLLKGYFRQKEHLLERYFFKKIKFVWLDMEETRINISIARQKLLAIDLRSLSYIIHIIHTSILTYCTLNHILHIHTPSIL